MGKPRRLDTTIVLGWITSLLLVAVIVAQQAHAPTAIRSAALAVTSVAVLLQLISVARDLMGSSASRP